MLVLGSLRALVRKVAIWARVTGVLGQYVVVVQPVVILAAARACMDAAWVLPTMSVNSG